MGVGPLFYRLFGLRSLNPKPSPQKASEATEVVSVEWVEAQVSPREGCRLGFLGGFGALGLGFGALGL